MNTIRDYDINDYKSGSELTLPHPSVYQPDHLPSAPTGRCANRQKAAGRKPVRASTELTRLQGMREPTAWCGSYQC